MDLSDERIASLRDFSVGAAIYRSGAAISLEKVPMPGGQAPDEPNTNLAEVVSVLLEAEYAEIVRINDTLSLLELQAEELSAHRVAS